MKVKRAKNKPKKKMNFDDVEEDVIPPPRLIPASELLPSLEPPKEVEEEVERKISTLDKVKKLGVGMGMGMGLLLPGLPKVESRSSEIKEERNKPVEA